MASKLDFIDHECFPRMTVFTALVRKAGVSNSAAAQVVGSGSRLQKATELLIIGSMNSKQMKKWLERQGATFQAGKGSHLRVFLNEKRSVLPMHGAAELGKGLESAIKRQLGLK